LVFGLKEQLVQCGTQERATNEQPHKAKFNESIIP